MSLIGNSPRPRIEQRLSGSAYLPEEAHSDPKFVQLSLLTSRISGQAHCSTRFIRLQQNQVWLFYKAPHLTASAPVIHLTVIVNVEEPTALPNVQPTPCWFVHRDLYLCDTRFYPWSPGFNSVAPDHCLLSQCMAAALALPRTRRPASGQGP